MFNFLKKEDKEFKMEEIFYPLSPRDDVDEKDIYYSKFKTALNKGCHIIAFTGRYGVGKTSIINSIMKKLNKKNNKSIRISLGNYKNADETEINNDEQSLNVNNDNIDTNDIETKILQQIIYTTDENKLPLSRFKRIKYISKMKKFLVAILSILIMFLVYIYYKKIYDVIINTLYNNSLSIFGNIISIFLCVLMLLSIWFIIYRLLLFITIKINVTSIKYKDLELSIDNRDDKSVFNKYLDEIVYYFKQTKTKLLVIEDLDRYGNISLEIFKKLKELNFLLNSNETIKNNGGVTFIYALRDDLFLYNEDRVKFFDYIIPVVSDFSSQNSKEYIMELYLEFKEKYKIDIDEKLLRIISLYIQDRRLLLNIFNEFRTYVDILKDNQKINYTELFALIGYKNINPCDFEKRLKYDGDLYNLFSNKSKFIRVINNEILLENKKINEEIQEMRKSQKINIDDIKKSFILDAIKNAYSPNYIHSLRICINDRELTIDDFINHEFDIEKNKNSRFQYMFQGRSKENIDSRIVESFIQKIEELNYDFSAKNKQIEDNIKLMDTNNAKSLEEILSIDEINDLIEDKELKILFNNKLLISLVKNGFIKENFEKDLSYFKTGDLSENDYDCLICADTNNKIGFDHEINNVDEVIKQIEAKDFKKDIILNNYICDNLLISDKNKTKRANFINLLGEINEYKLKFLENYLYYNESNFLKLIKEVFNDKICLYILKDTSTVKDKNKWLKIILENILISDNDEVLNELKDYIQNNELLLNSININSIFESNICKIKPVLNSYDDIDLKIIELLYNKEIYIPNLSFFYKLIELYDIDDENIKNAFLDTIFDDDRMISYKNNILKSSYFFKVYDELNGYNSKEQNIIKLLNDESINEDIKIKVINSEKANIKNLIDINDLEIWNHIVNSHKYEISMNNLLAYYESTHDINETIFKILNDLGDNYTCVEDSVFKEFENALLYSSFTDKIDYKIIANKFDYEISSFDKNNNINVILLDGLIEQNKVVINCETYNYLEEKKFVPRLIKIVLNRIDSFLEIIEDIDLDYTIIDNIFESEVDFAKKILFLNKVDFKKINRKALSKILSEIIKNNGIFDDEIVSKIFMNLTENDKIKYFILLHSQNTTNIKYLHRINDIISKIRNGVSTTVALEYSENREILLKYLKSKKIINKYDIKNNKIKVSFSKTNIE